MDIEGEPLIFLARLGWGGEGGAGEVRSLAGLAPLYPALDGGGAVAWCERRTGKTLAPSQREALKTVLGNRVAVITGGPGVGKTTLVNSILTILRAKDVKCLLCAPTGRAAKRLTETTGWLGSEDDPPPAGDRPRNWSVYAERVQSARLRSPCRR